MSTGSVGPVARAESGHAILFIHPRGRHLLRRIEHATRQTIDPMDIPTMEVINQHRVARFHERITAGLEHPEGCPRSPRSSSNIAPRTTSRTDGSPRLWLHRRGRYSPAPSGYCPHPRLSPIPATAHAHRTVSSQTIHGGDRRNGPNRRGDRGWKRRTRTAQMETFRIEVGHAQQVKPANIVGAIANETGLDSGFIGRDRDLRRLQHGGPARRHAPQDVRDAEASSRSRDVGWTSREWEWARPRLPLPKARSWNRSPRARCTRGNGPRARRSLRRPTRSSGPCTRSSRPSPSRNGPRPGHERRTQPL